MKLAITCIIVIIYLIALFGVSAWAQKKQKAAEAAGSSGNFLIASKSLPTALVAFMMAGAGIGSINTTGIAQQVQTAGLSGMCAGFAGAVALIVLALFGAKRMRALPYSTMPSMAMADWRDFLTMSTCAISNQADQKHRAEREKIYMNTVRKYSKDDTFRIKDMLLSLIHI